MDARTGQPQAPGVESWLRPVRDFLHCPTPDAWVQCAQQNLPLLLIDHANCEKKAASTALGLLYRYTDNYRLQHKLSRLAREELRHYEQVMAIMRQRGIRYIPVSASRYAQELMRCQRKDEPGRLVDTLIAGAVIEARSCERFAALAPNLDEELGRFYLSLLKSEARHFQDYLALAREVGGEHEVLARQELLLGRDAELVESVDTEFRFHSGKPL
ncbi:MAG: tRNA-(ms[2]io[6]A)-hydroxylase [Halieaceae bacterium]|jgi:tRNA-(ms[2]io[6]A)-hydroxylase|nr:tRNA-(ms[2]io[6]A)-hydroxylase [Halieaceae bacterium]